MTLRSAFLFLLAFRTDCWSARAVSPPAAVPDAAPSPAFAWYIPLTLEPHFLRQAVVLSGSILDTNTAGDVVAALFADPGLEASRSAVPLFDPRVKLRWATLPFGVEDVVSPAYRERVRGRMWSFQKLDAWLLTAYRSVVVLDSDMLFLRNADELFWTPPGSHSDGPMSPFNAGLFVVRPDAADFADLVALARAGNETACGGWLGAWPNASFYQSEFEQGACGPSSVTLVKSFLTLTHTHSRVQASSSTSFTLPAPRGPR